MIRVGTAGWSLPTDWRERFPDGESHLERYAGVLSACEINRTFKTMPRDSTFGRWADTVPEDFRFSVKTPREITHDRRLADATGPLERFLDGIRHLGERLGPVLVQLPPSLEYEAEGAHEFLAALRDRHDGPVALEARHGSWFGEEPDSLLRSRRVTRVAADPPRADADGRPGGHGGLAYFRLHGSPDTYRSPYRGADLDAWEEAVRRADGAAGEVWCIFDNTAEGEATGDALELARRLEGGG